MSALVLDAGVWLAARDADDRFHAECREIIAGRSAELTALDLTLYEVANVATVRWRSATEAERLVSLVLKACRGNLLRADVELLRAAAGTAAERSITVYDAAYVVSAAERGATLVSTDLADLVNAGLAISPADTPDTRTGQRLPGLTTRVMLNREREHRRDHRPLRRRPAARA